MFDFFAIYFGEFESVFYFDIFTNWLYPGPIVPFCYVFPPFHPTVVFSIETCYLSFTAKPAIC